MNMIEKCARAAGEAYGAEWDQLSTADQNDAHNLARAVLRTLREPTPEMLWAHELPHIGPDEIRECWQAMIDAALSGDREG